MSNETRHVVKLNEQLTVIVGHGPGSRVETSPTGRSLAGPIYAKLYIGKNPDLDGEPTEQISMLADPDDALDWVDAMLMKHDYPDLDALDKVGKVSHPLVMEGKDGPNIRAATGNYNDPYEPKAEQA